MARILTFDEERHEYVVNGEVKPYVSEITRFIARDVYGDVAQYMLDNAADRGTRVHKATQMLDVVGDVECDEDIVPYVQAYARFVREHRPEWKLIEKSFYNTADDYCGTVDRFGILDGKQTIVDIKTSSSVQKQLYSAQLALYARGLESNDIDVDRAVVLHLKKDGTYKIVEIDQSFATDLADACLTLYKALKKKPRKKKEE